MTKQPRKHTVKGQVHRVGYRPSVAQHHITEVVKQGRARVAGFFGGIGSGKTVVGQHILRCAMTQWAPGGRFMIVVPSYQTFIQSTLAEIRKFWPAEGDLWEYRRPNNQPQLHARWWYQGKMGSSVCFIRSAQDLRTVESIRGPTLAGIWGDEVGTWHAGHAAYDLAIGRLRMTDRDVKGIKWHNWFPRVWLTGSPRWGWLNKLFGVAGSMPKQAWTTGYYSKYNSKDPNPVNAFYIRACATEGNIYNEKGYAEFLRSQYGEAFAAQELDGDFVSPTGRVYPHFYPHISVISNAVAAEAYASCPIKVGGVDWGYGTCAMVAVGITADQAVIVRRAWTGHQRTAQDMAEIARAWEKELGIQKWWCDPEGGRKGHNQNIQHWKGRVRGSVPVRATVKAANNALEPGRNTLRNCMRLQKHIPNVGNPGEPGTWLYVSNDCDGNDSLVNDLQVFSYKEAGKGEEIDEARTKPKEASHRPAALRYAVHSELSTGRTRTSWEPGL